MNNDPVATWHWNLNHFSRVPDQVGIIVKRSNAEILMLLPQSNKMLYEGCRIEKLLGVAHNNCWRRCVTWNDCIELKEWNLIQVILSERIFNELCNMVKHWHNITLHKEFKTVLILLLLFISKICCFCDFRGYVVQYDIQVRQRILFNVECWHEHEEQTITDW